MLKNYIQINTIKSKVSLILAVITVVFFAVIFVFCYTYFKESERLILNSYNHLVAETAQALNKAIVTVEHNASDLAAAGSSYATRKIPESTMKQFLVSDLIHYKEPVGAGIWFEPYIINPNEKYHSLYAMRGKNGDIIMEDIWDTEEYNYFQKEWYKRTISQVTPESNIVWGLSQGDYTEFKSLITASAGIYDNKGKLVGISEVDWDFDACVDVMKQIKPTPNTFTLFADKKNDFVYFLTDKNMDSKAAVGKSLKEIPWYSDKLKNGISFKYNNTEYVPFIKILDNQMMFIVNIPKMEMLGLMYIKVFALLFIMGLLSGSLISLLYLTLNKDVINPINKLISIAKMISSGASETEIRIEKPEEFALLASTYNKMTDDIKQITSKQTKMNYELSVANSIQISSLPNVFPPFPEHKEFSIFASMDPAREVGGDFYDFFFKDSEHLMFLVADVSGKGVPAALFMMTVKTLINNLSQTISSPKELIQTINKKLCDNKKEGFFVTMFACIINVNTGEMNYINCGHNPPLIKRNNGQYEYLDIDPNMVLGIFDDIDYKIFDTTLNTGDSIFLYTDGLTEAFNPNGQVYGEQRLKDCLNSIEAVSVDKVIKEVKDSVKEYTQGLSQTDDLTMLLFQYFKTLRKFERPAVKENYKEFSNWLLATCSEWNLNDELTNKLDMCGEEIFANICFYAYPFKVRNIAVSLEKYEKEVIMVFEDSGIMYNPLEKPDPDLTIPPKERKLGGLGIFMVKQMAKEVEYQRVKNKNILSLKFDV